ncbi:MAG: HEAT repeat domain-containing protein [Thermoguttaceae bacterium]|jgi:hypothetical protein
MKNMMKNMLLPVFLLALCPSDRVWALGEEHFGNAPLNEADFQDWPGIMPLVNHPSRVYHKWVDGNEQFYYRGDTAALNDALRQFAASKSAVHELLLRPAPCIAESLNGVKEIPYNWNLHIVGGDARFETTLDQGSKVWSKSPTMTVCVGGDIDLGKIEIPKGVSIVDLADLSRRYREALASKDKTVRGWGAGELAHLDRYDAENLAAIVKLLKDEDDWVRRNAVGALAVFGKKAETVVPTLREMRSTQDKNLKDQIEKAIKEIQQAKDTTAAEEGHRAILKRISEFRAGRVATTSQPTNKSSSERSIEVEPLPRLWQQVADAQVIVVATALDSASAPPHRPGDLPETFIRFQVKRVLKGKLDNQIITTRTPTAAAEFIGKDWIVLLSPEYMAGKHSYASSLGVKHERNVKAMLSKPTK